MHLSMASIVMARVVGLQLHYMLIRSTRPRVCCELLTNDGREIGNQAEQLAHAGIALNPLVDCGYEEKSIPQRCK